jgi:hypothetical protein
VVLLQILKLFKKNKNQTIEKFENSDISIKLNIQTVLIIKENIPFLREWIIYHLNLGFDKIYLYDNTGSIGYDSSTNKNNKYNFNFNEIIEKNEDDIQEELNSIINDFKDNIIYVKWQPKDKDGNIIYGQDESIVHYVNNLPQSEINNEKVFTYTAFIDVDEFIFSPDNINLNNFIKEKYNEGVNRLIIQQKKFIDRFCGGNKKIIDMHNTIENIDTTHWAPKNIVNNKYLDTTKISTIHVIEVKEGKTLTLPQNILRFNHYNINNKQINWMKTYFNRNTDFESGMDNSMSRYKNIIDTKCGDKCSDKNKLINYSKINNELCYLK